MIELNFTRPFVILKRKADREAWLFEGDLEFVDMLEDIVGSPEDNSLEEQFLTFSAIPFAQIKERGFQVRDDGVKISCLKIKRRQSFAIDDLLGILPQEQIQLAGEIEYDYSPEEYKKIVQEIIDNEIGNGEGANFVIPRKGFAQIKDFTQQKALSVFRNLLQLEYGSHWTFLFFDGEKYILGASPEAHIAVKKDRVKMHPISGTFRKSIVNNDLKSIRRQFIDFISNKKEIFELFMVVDEELKMMANICREGGMIIGPLLKEMAFLIHTEYLLSGKSHKNIIDILRASMFAATVTGSPLENACNIIYKYEKNARRFYASCLALTGRDEDGEDFLDSAIAIRTMEISNQGQVVFGVGATLVRDSDPEEELRETESKINSVLSGIQNQTPTLPPKLFSYFEEDDEILELMQLRNQKLSGFWFLSQEDEDLIIPCFQQKKVVIINNEDDFCFMMMHMLTALGFEVRVIKYQDYDYEKDQADLTIIGPGPGNPNNYQDAKMLKIIETVQKLKNDGHKFFAVCLGHQILCRVLGIEVVKKVNPLQGVQEQIVLFGKKQRVGFYNTFVGKFQQTLPDIDISFNADTAEIQAIKGESFASVQFHPESILTQNGLQILKDLLLNLFKS